MDGTTVWRALLKQGVAMRAAPYQFGALRDEALSDEPRIVIESYVDESGEEPVRLSLALGEALHLGRRIAQLVDLVTAT